MTTIIASLDDMRVAVNMHALHNLAIYHRRAVLAGTTCGCFFCLSWFPPSAIEKWADNEQTAQCPRCHVDAVLPDTYGFELTADLLEAMHKRWFCFPEPARP